jgi:hypothetical protein
MSTIITISNEKKVTAKTAIKELLKDKQVKLYKHPFSQTINYSSCTLYVNGDATRGITVDTEKDEITIRVNIMSSDADLNLAVSISKTLSKLCGSPIWVENAPNPIRYEDVDNGALKKVLFENQVAGAALIKQMLTEGNPIEIPGLFAGFWPGTEYLEEKNLIAMHSKLVLDFTALQNLESRGIRITNPIVTEKDGKQITFAVLSPNHQQLIPKCDSVVLALVKPENFMAIPFEIFIENSGIEIYKVDAVQMVFPALDSKEFRALMSRMREFEVPLL